MLSCDISCICYRVLDFIVHNADPKGASKASSSQLYFSQGGKFGNFAPQMGVASSRLYRCSTLVQEE